jgi:hypothetical protein
VNPLRAGRSPGLLKRIFSRSASGSLWERHDISGASASRKDGVGRAKGASSTRPNRFREALEERGGLFAVFGNFLAGRADLLPGEYLTPLREIQVRRQGALSPSSLPEVRDRIVQAEWLRSAPCSEVYAATYVGRSVIVEVFLPEGGCAASEWEELERQIALLKSAPEAALTGPAVLEQFREWLSFQADSERKRAVLRSVRDIPVPCVTRFPALVAELQSSRCIVYERMEGAALSEALASEAQDDTARAAKALDLWAESLLEQTLFLSLVDADAQASNYLLLAEGGLGFRTLPAMVPVPVEWHNELLQYLTSAIAGNSSRAMQMLARICSGANPYEAEQVLLERLSALEPELKINTRVPDTVVTLENYWRAMSRTTLRPQLFLELLHRNLVVLGQLAPQIPAAATPVSDAPGGARPPDVISESLWPVLGRLVQFRMGEITSTEKGPEWLASSGLLLLLAVRQAGVLLEQMRDNDLALEIESDPETARGGQRNRRVASVIHTGIGLVLFLFSLQMAQRTTGIWEIAAGSAAAVCAVAVFILVARIE